MTVFPPNFFLAFVWHLCLPDRKIYSLEESDDCFFPKLFLWSLSRSSSHRWFLIRERIVCNRPCMQPLQHPITDARFTSDGQIKRWVILTLKPPTITFTNKKKSPGSVPSCRSVTIARSSDPQAPCWYPDAWSVCEFQTEKPSCRSSSFITAWPATRSLYFTKHGRVPEGENIQLPWKLHKS